jgi:hypothetical protein
MSKATKTKAWSKIICEDCGCWISSCSGECKAEFHDDQEIYCSNISYDHFCKECHDNVFPGD